MTTAGVTKSSSSGVATDYRTELWRTANALRGGMDAAKYKHVVLGLIFLKYVSNAFEEAHARIEALRDEGADPEDPDESRGDNIFWVLVQARWPYLQRSARQPQIGRLVDEAMAAIERDNPVLDGVLSKDYARPALDQTRLGQVVDLVSNIKVGGAEAEATDVLGEVYEYFLEQFALAEGRKGGEFYTPRSVVRLLVEMLKPYRGRVYGSCCGSSGMFVQSKWAVSWATRIPSAESSRAPLTELQGRVIAQGVQPAALRASQLSSPTFCLAAPKTCLMDQRRLAMPASVSRLQPCGAKAAMSSRPQGMFPASCLTSLGTQ